jgi:hypothetical protein
MIVAASAPQPQTAAQRRAKAIAEDRITGGADSGDRANCRFYEVGGSRTSSRTLFEYTCDLIGWRDTHTWTGHRRASRCGFHATTVS